MDHDANERAGSNRMTRPHYTTAMTYNIWGAHAWPARQPAMRAFLESRPADVLGIQELREDTQSLIDEVLSDHDRVHDDFPGWTTEGNIWWNRHAYTLVEHGAEDIGIKEEFRRLFWVRLASTADPSVHLVFANAHFTWVGHPHEARDHINPRIQQAHNAVAVLDRLAADDPCVFVGDFNDYGHPRSILFKAGFGEGFSSLGRMSPITHPVDPTARPDRGYPKHMPAQKPLDWQFHRGAIAPVSSEVVDFRHEGMAPSDHYPVLTTYAFGLARS